MTQDKLSTASRTDTGLYLISFLLLFSVDILDVFLSILMRINIRILNSLGYIFKVIRGDFLISVGAYYFSS